MKPLRLLSGVIALFLAHSAYGQGFVPVKPATCPATTEVNWSYNVSSVGQCSGSGCSQDHGWMLPSDPNHPNNYINNLNNDTNISGNEYIHKFGFRVASFNLETFYDFVDVLHFGGGQHLTGGSNYGNPISGWYDYDTSTNGNIGSLPRDQFRIRFHSDGSVEDTGVYLDRARVCTNNPNLTLLNTERVIGPYSRASGVLLGAGDVAYFSASVGSRKNGDTCSLAHDTFALWADPSLPNDFDMYVRCGAQPTPTQYDYVGYSNDNQEFVHATTANCPCGSDWHIAVVSYQGSGWFNLVNHKHYASEHRSSITARNTLICPPINQTTRGLMKTEISRGFKHFFGANEGTRYWDTIHFDPVGGNASDIWIHSCANGRPNSDVCRSGFTCNFTTCHVSLYGNWYDGPTLSHELGHHVNCLKDEYEDDVGTECGHSIMGSQFYTNTNYCYCTNQPSGENRCAWEAGDHGYDTTPEFLTPLTTGTAWINLIARAPTVGMFQTPDNYDYTTFDFNGMYGVVTVP